MRLFEPASHFDWPPALTASTSIRNDFNIYLKPYPCFKFPCISLDSLQQRRAIFDCPSRWLNWRGIGRPGRPEWSPKRSFHLKSPYSVISPFRCIMLPTCATAAFFWKAAAHSRCNIPVNFSQVSMVVMLSTEIDKCISVHETNWYIHIIPILTKEVS